MDKTEDNAKAYDEIEYEEGLTFGKIGHFFKKGWLIMIVCIVAAVLATCAVILPIKFYYKSEPVVKASIEYIYDGIHEGKDPNGGTLDTDNIISSYVLSRAVEEENLGSVITDISKLREKMRVESVLTEEYIKLADDAAKGVQSAIDRLRTYTMFPTQFDIILSEPSKLGLTDGQAVSLVDRIIKVYYADFAERFTVTKVFDPDVYSLSDSVYFEFTDIYDEYVSALTTVDSYVAELQAKSPKFTSTKYNTTLVGLSSELGRLLRNYESFNTFVLVNNIWRNKATALSALNETKQKLTVELENITKYVSALQAQIADIQPNKVVTDSNNNHSETITYPVEYYEYQAQLNAYNLRILDYNNRLTNIDRRIENINGETEASPADVENAMSELKTLETASAQLVEKVNNVVADYYDTMIAAQSVRTVRLPIMTRKSSDLNVLIAVVAAAIVGLIVACIITGVRIAKANAIRRAAAIDGTDETDNKN